MLLTLNFHPTLQPYTGVPNHTFDIHKLSDIKDVLCVLFPKLRTYIKGIVNGNLRENLALVTPDNKLIKKSDYEFNILKYDELTIVPIIEGGGGKVGAILGIVAGIALIATAVVLSGGAAAGLAAPALGGLTTVGGILKIGIGLVVSGLMQALMKPPKPPGSNTSSETRRNNDMFDALENTTDPSSSVPLIYGRPRVAGQMLSGYVETMTHGETDNIFVSDLFYKDINEITRDESDVTTNKKSDPAPGGGRDIVAITLANPVRVTTADDHRLEAYEPRIHIRGISGTTQLNNNYYFYNIINKKTVALYTDSGLTNPVDGTSFTPYVSGGYMSYDPPPSSGGE